MLKGTTKSGFRYEIITERLNNFELLEILSEVDENPLLLPKVLNLLLGERQSKNLKNYLRDEEGFVSTDKIRETLEDIFAAQNKIKN
ncbi:hypothetical protein OQI88_11885 [Lactococcus lactis]|uniref:hypothetical protein n=1 Tax=Lactococcus lactis TaxID=1358 RepID=UPI0024696A49|nr:hypothetical protein [Lactococcus lactis]MDH5115174.1 hypothetical protein [Lactococcus lactis]